MELLTVSKTLALLGVFGLFFRLYNALVRKPERLRSMLRKQGISGPKPAFLLGNIKEIKKAQSNTEKAETIGAPALHKCAAALFPFFEEWRKQFDSFFRSRTSGIVNHGILFPIDHPTRSYGSLNTYHLPTSNLPPEFRLESSSRMQLPQIQQPQSQASAPQLLGSGSGGSPFTKTQWANWHPQNQITMHETSTAMGYRKFNMSVYN
uniref:Uncharacterized protein n=1 Tax=Fagus sylvatica TaxID=28930 RepID=A0A2N9FDU5_FAGSY